MFLNIFLFILFPCLRGGMSTPKKIKEQTRSNIAQVAKTVLRLQMEADVV